MPWIGIGNSVLKYGSSGGWTAYWSTRYPSALTLTVDSDTQITLSWTNNGTGYDDIRIERGTDGVSYAEIYTALASATSYINTGLTANTVYYYRIRYKKDTNYSAYSSGFATTFQTEMGLYITGLTTPLSNGQKVLLNGFVTSLKEGMGITNLSDVFDVLYVLGGETSESSLKNLVKNAHHGTLQGTPNPAFTAGTGFVSDGSNGYIDTHYNPVTEGDNFTLADGAVGFYSETNAANDNYVELGNHGADSNYLYFQAKVAAGGAVGALNGTLAHTFSGSLVASTIGLFITTRDGLLSTDNLMYLNKGVPPDDNTGGAADGLSNNNIYVLCYNGNGTPTAFTLRRLSLVFFTKHLTTQMRDVIYDAFIAYKNSEILFRNASLITRSSLNPLLYNTGYGTPFLFKENKIGSTYYGISQNGALTTLNLYTTTDLINWTFYAGNPILSATPASWDEKYLVHPCVIKVGSEWWMYYTGEDAADKMTIGLAKSNDFITWTKYGVTPVHSTAGNCTAPCVIKIGATYYMYYAAYAASNNSPIAYATSADGITWFYQGIALNISAGDWEVAAGYTGLTDPWVIQRTDGYYQMTYTALYFNVIVYQIIGMAISVDGINWTRRNKLLLQENGVGWESLALMDMFQIENTDGSTDIYYAGTPDWTDGGIGFATIP